MNIHPMILTTVEVMDENQLRKILTTKKEYVRVNTHIFNAGSYVKLSFTDKFSNIRNRSGYDYIMESFYLKRYIKDWTQRNNIPIGI